MKACAFTGHRPQSFPWGYNEADPACIKLKETINNTILKLIAMGYKNFFSGMALGVDTWAAEAVLNLRDTNPTLKLHCILPCATQPQNWPEAAQKRYFSIIRRADFIFYVSKEYHKNCMQERNHFMVKNASLLLAVYNGQQRTGTGATVNYARKLGRQIIIINPISLNYN